MNALLTGKAHDVYSRLSDVAARDYSQLREALLHCYDLTEDVYRLKFRRIKPDGGESPGQFMVRLKDCLKKWMARTRTEDTTEAIKDLFVIDLDVMVKMAERFLIAHNRRFHVTDQLSARTQSTDIDSTAITASKEESTQQRSSAFSVLSVSGTVIGLQSAGFEVRRGVSAVRR